MKTKEELDMFDYQYNDNLIIEPTIGIGLKWKDRNGHDCESILEKRYFKNKKRIVYLKQSNFLYSIGAQHYYAELSVDYPMIKDHTENRILMTGGYGDNKPKIIDCLKIEVQRKLTKFEKDLSGSPIGKIGDMTIRFNLPQDAIKSGIELFKKRFSKGWILIDKETEKTLCKK